MAEENILDPALNTLESRILEAKGQLDIITGSDGSSGVDSYRFLDRRSLELLYRDELTINGVANNLAGMQQAVRKMSSSFLPIDFFLDNNFGALSAVIEDSFSESESYENTFMRMLGMPQSDEFTQAELLLTVDENGLSNKETSFEYVELNILDQRQIKRPERRVIINDGIYDLNALTEEDAQKELKRIAGLGGFKAGILAGGLDSDLVTEPRFTSARINKLSEHFFKFSHLLLPPIQDSRISRCINEADKIVAPPFSSTVGRVINRKKLRSSLLETIIRIRLDRLSGASDAISAPPPEPSGGLTISVPTPLPFGKPEEEVDPNADTFGILEALFILRLRSALSGLAQDMRENVNNIIIEILKNNVRPGTQPEGNAGTHDRAASTPVNLVGKKDSLSGIKIGSLKNQKIVEDAIISLLGDNTEVLSLQAQTQRNSTIRDAHLMDGLISIIDLPRKRISKKISELEKKKIDSFNKKADPIRSDINSGLGVDIGVGTVDMIVFSLALFTMKEENLVGLLSDKQFEDLKNGKSTAELLPGTGDKVPTIDAINELSDLVISGYKTFIDELKKTSR